ncbi:uncharacterized protein RHIMIDRAFT_233792 [Rhizopus microsporus ATCC 52813]|uniref:Cas12f1-like TNB domain-containing protein n=1 Tax=Rhizopus microsporus ATCC 52813 TaxID=1340429 RepID=A0A2G4T5A4_RHIZD|nr:uncharacterized protein RHIMIDRAFT_233792 [Rhizopus microsporus ATCC 52813]PHZ16191.1 hypothetical protein RHIMIDRAFT_233792 [Rhizopus microsporus ATCC 52813]
MFEKDLVKIKGARCGVIGKLWKDVKKREKEDGLITITVDELNTSKACNNCEKIILEPAKRTRGNSILVCKTCNTLWQRDMNAAKNMMTISLSTWRGDGRPIVFQRSNENSNRAT